jgi:ADP-heptose:LPS heptosyltransferase
VSNDDFPVLDPRLVALQKENTALMWENEFLRERVGQLEQVDGPAPLAALGRRLKSWVEAKLPEATLPGASEEQKRFAAALASQRGDLRIALSAFGGLGDALWTTAIVEAIHRKHPGARLHLFVFERGHADIFRGNPYVSGVYLVDRRATSSSWPRSMHGLLRSGALELWYENRYATKVHRGALDPTPAAERAATERAFRSVDVNFDQWPMANNLVSLAARRRGLSLIELVAASAGLTLDDPQLFIFPTPEDAAVLPRIDALGDYVTVHHGADPHFVGNTLQTKNWRREHWEAVIERLRTRHGVEVVQLGTANEQRLTGARHEFMGHTNARETALIIRRARAHLDTEGGLVHMARAAHTPALVLFGPTPVDFFGYRQNVNLAAGACRECWWSTRDWQARCPRGMATPACMDDHSVAAVTLAADELLARVGRIDAPPSVADVAALGPDALAESVLAQLRARSPARVLVMVSPHSARLAAALAAAGHALRQCVLAGATAATPLDPAAAPMRYGNTFLLPYETGAFDAVIDGDADARTLPAALQRQVDRERLRVLAPDGLWIVGGAVIRKEVR